jgi:hypothetical protein
VSEVSFPDRAWAVRRATARLCGRLGSALLHEVPLPNGRRADILALEDPGGVADLRAASRVE